MIIGCLGQLEEQDLRFVNSEVDKEILQKMTEKMKRKGQESGLFTKVFKDKSPVAVDLLRKLLQFSPENRITVFDALAHPYFEDLHAEEDEETTEPISLFDFAFEKEDLSKAEYK